MVGGTAPPRQQQQEAACHSTTAKTNPRLNLRDVKCVIGQRTAFSSQQPAISSKATEYGKMRGVRKSRALEQSVDAIRPLYYWT